MQDTAVFTRKGNEARGRGQGNQKIGTARKEKILM